MKAKAAILRKPGALFTIDELDIAAPREGALTLPVVPTITFGHGVNGDLASTPYAANSDHKLMIFL